MSQVHAFAADGLAPVPYAHGAVVAPSSVLVLLAGACPLGADGVVLHPGDVKRQMNTVIDNTLVALNEVGGDVTHIARARIYIASADRRVLHEAWSAFADRLDVRRFPSTLVGVATLGYEGQLVEVEFDAVLPAG